MSARDVILSTIRAQRVSSAPRPSPYHATTLGDDTTIVFTAHATRAAAEVRRLKSWHDIPAAIADVLRGRNMKATIHLPDDSPSEELLQWDSAPGLAREHTAPGPDDAAIALAPFAIAETGTLVYPAGRGSPASWHFRPELEIAIVRAASIFPDFEAVLARVKAQGAMPSTLNLVTGPSRTGDIEQTLELGAHGPKALVVLVVDE